MEAIQQEVLARSLNQTVSNSTLMTVDLDSATGGKQWGRIQCRLDVSAIQVRTARLPPQSRSLAQPFVRHRETSTFGQKRAFDFSSLAPRPSSDPTASLQRKPSVMGFYNDPNVRQGTRSALTLLDRVQPYFNWPDSPISLSFSGTAPKFIRGNFTIFIATSVT